MTTTPTASPELPDLDHLEALARAATAGPWLHRRDPGNPIGAQHCVKLAGENGAWVCDCIDNADRSTVGGIAGERNAAFIAAANPEQVLALIALARRAQPEGDMGYPISVSRPEGEAPQAVQFYRRASNQNWREATAEHIAHLKLFGGYEYRTLYTARAATLSPLCGAQHAESGKEAEPFKWPNGCDTTIPRALRYLANNPRPSGGEQPFNGAHLYQLAGEMEAAARSLAAQQAAAPGAILEILRDVHDTLESQADSDIDHFEDDEEEREGAPMQYAARKVMEVIEMLKAAAPAGSLINEGTSAPGTPEAPKGGAQLLAELLGAPSLYSQVYVAATVGQGWAGPAARDAADAAVQEYGDSPAGLVEDLQSILDEVLRVDGAAQLDGGQEGSAS